MNTPKAILIGFALVAAAVYFSRDVAPAQAAIGGASFQAVAGPQGSAGSIWRVNSDTGSVSWCLVGSSGGTYEKSLSCTPWTK